jgi:hypothetical protein
MPSVKVEQLFQGEDLMREQVEITKVEVDADNQLQLVHYSMGHQVGAISVGEISEMICAVKRSYYRTMDFVTTGVAPDIGLVSTCPGLLTLLTGDLSKQRARALREDAAHWLGRRIKEVDSIQRGFNAVVRRDPRSDLARLSARLLRLIFRLLNVAGDIRQSI